MPNCDFLKKDSRLKRILIFSVFLAVSTVLGSQTWQLKEDLSLEKLSKADSESFDMGFTMMKKAADQSSPKQMLAAAENLSDKFPELTDGEDWQAYLEAETAFAKKKWKLGSELFTDFLDKYPVSDFYDAALERTYQIASAFLSGQKRRAFGIFMIKGYDDGEVMMRKIADKAGTSPIAHKALTTLAESFEQRNLYLDAYDVWTEIALRWPTGKSGQESLLAMARCMHSAYNGADYDGAPIKSAIGYYEQYKLRYPDLAEKKRVHPQYENASEQLAYKYYSIADYYHRTDDYQSASLYCNYVLDNHGDTEVAEMADEKLKEIEDRPKDIVKIKPEEKSLFWRFIHFFDFNPTEKG